MNNETLENGFLDVAGHRIAYTRQGRGSAIALVHGIPTSRHLWRNVIPLLAASGHEVLAIDLLGYGDSDKPSDADLGIQAQSEIIFQALSALGWKRATIVGHDIGGGIAQLVAINHPEILDRLVLIDSILYDSFPEPGIARLKEPVWDEILGAANFDLKKGLAKGFSRGMFHTDRVTAELVDAYERPFHGIDGRHIPACSPGVEDRRTFLAHGRRRGVGRAHTPCLGQARLIPAIALCRAIGRKDAQCPNQGIR